MEQSELPEVGDGPLLLPYGYARRFGVLLREKDGRRELCCRDDVSLSAVAEVQRWQFEVWNELWGLRWPDQYMGLYAASAKAVKAVHASLRVGGPATAVSMTAPPSAAAAA